MEIIYAGGSHYGVGGYKSLWKYFDKIYLIKDNPPEILDNLREEDEVIQNFNSVDCRYVFLGGYPRFISPEQLENKIYINVHGALLPHYRGMHSTFYAIMNGEDELGITFHLVDEFMDSGDIIAQYKFRYTRQSIQEINDRIDELVFEHAGHVLYDYINGILKPIPQDEELATYGARRNLEDCLVDFNMSNVMLERFFCALTPNYPYPMLKIKGELYEILPKTRIVSRNYYGPIGRAVFIDVTGTWIKTKDGFLIVQNVRKYGSDVEIKLESLISIGYRFI